MVNAHRCRPAWETRNSAACRDYEVHHVQSNMERAAIHYPKRISAGARSRSDRLARIGLRIGRNSDGSIRIYQPPSDRNALGRVRFNFPNQFLVYQHDTPDKYLFSKLVRAYSHGCMRVEYPDKYAETLLSISQPEEGYTVQRLHSLYGKGERNINLNIPVPVYLTYQTAFIDDSGKMNTRPDIYGLDKTIVDLLNRDSPSVDVPIARNYGGDSAPVRGRTPSRRIEAQPYSWDRSWDPYSAASGASSYHRFDRPGSW
jgi:hypothetical protein